MGCRCSSGLRPGDVPAERFEGDDVRLRTATYASVQRVDVGDFRGGEFEVEDVEVLGEAGGFDRLRDHRAAFLQVPAEHYLGGCFAVLAADLENRRVVEGALR